VFVVSIGRGKRGSNSCFNFVKVVGEEGLAGKPMQAGALLDLIDICAGRLSAEYCAGPVATGTGTERMGAYPLSKRRCFDRLVAHVNLRYFFLNKVFQ
jgi:hypothetical protein